ncbi:helix-turn-helix transcriptional regulator [Rossellomorea vietnamensis]|uniref:helix-turn-helix transcriptional regulator n=1 Tax=Rossellomorea vietnamensis TaxID=218284 RepID=UPI000551701F|nr:helix-turn-helix transcriptional regulator [Rossellomorea vietnamensis]
MKIVIKDQEEFNELLIRQGFSKRLFAKETKLSEATIALISNGNRNPSPRVAKKICLKLEVEFDEIFKIEKLEKLSSK